MSGASSRRRGHDYERHLAAWLRQQGVQAVTSRELNGGRQEGSDIICDLPVAVEAKNHKTLDLAGWLGQAMQDAGDAPAAVFIKRRSKPVSRSYVVMEAGQFVALLRPDTTF